MKHITISALAIGWLLASCGRADITGPEIIGPEPEPVFVLQSDSISSGELLGINIGSTAVQVYDAIQKIHEGQNTNHLQIVGNIFTTVKDLKDRIPLYNQLLFDETRGTSRGIQVYFENGRIKSIWTNNGDKPNRWPTGEPASDRLSVGDPISTVYPKLVKLSVSAMYARRFERISLGDKNTATGFDPILADASQWYFSMPAQEKRFYVYYLYFEKGSLLAIKRDLMGNNYHGPE